MATVTAPRCGTCTGYLVSISLTRPGGDMTMWSCSTCDLRWWQQGDEPTDLGGVLRTMADDRRAAKGR
jgi:hypothetical protein